MRWRRVAREPLVHFLLGGLAIFALFAARGEPADPSSRTIHLTREDRGRLAVTFEATMERPPTEAELAVLTERWVHDEVLYREALRLGLDQDDPVIRRRLGQKMDVIAASAVDAEEPSDAELARWLASHRSRFARDPALSFDQLYFTDQGAAARAMRALRGGADWRELGSASALPRSLDQASRGDAVDQFGDGLVRSLDALAPGSGWQGPLPSALGWHLVRLRARTDGGLPPLAQIRTRVEDDWRSETEHARQEAAYKVLRDAYRVEIDQ